MGQVAHEEKGALEGKAHQEEEALQGQAAFHSAVVLQEEDALEVETRSQGWSWMETVPQMVVLAQKEEVKELHQPGSPSSRYSYRGDSSADVRRGLGSVLSSSPMHVPCGSSLPCTHASVVRF